jgi:DNA-binding CsgD family transcriptional regulator
MSSLLTNLPEEFYKTKLENISGLKFTPREIDVIACILQGKSLKGTAEFLSTATKPISDKSIASHILNITRKIGGNGRDSIINFIERSEKYHFIRDYYLSILIHKEFIKTLLEIDNVTELAKHCIIITSAEALINTSIINAFKYYLEYINKKITIMNKGGLSDVIDILKNFHENVLYICIINMDEYISNKTLIESLVNTINQKSKIVIVLSYSDQGQLISSDIDQGSGILDIRLFQNFYFLFLEITAILHKKLPIEEVTKKFKEKYKIIQGDKLSDNIKSKPLSFKDDKHKETFKIPFNIVRVFYPYIILPCILFSLIFIYMVIRGTTDSPLNKKNTLDKIYDEQCLLTKYHEDLSVGNLTKDDAEKNFTFIQKFTPIIESIKEYKKIGYLEVSLLQPQELINVLFNLNAISSFYLFKEHDAKTAETILLYAKDLAENFVSLRSRLPIAFNSLTEAETLTELSVIRDLPELYTITIYFLGRCALFQNNLDLAEKYFKLSKYLGETLNIFEGYISVRNGIAIIKGDRVSSLIQNKNYELAIHEIKECIKIYRDGISNNKTYKLNYRPNNQKSNIINPNQDVYNKIDCWKRIIKLYTKLIKHADNKTDKINALSVIHQQFIGDNNNFGLLDTLEGKEVLPRIKADMYNTLGFFLLSVYDDGIDFTAIKKSIIRKLDLKNDDELIVIGDIFYKAKTMSRSTEFAKADAYEGLIRVNERLVANNKLSEDQIHKLHKLNNEYKAFRDNINNGLKRTFKH